MFPFAKLRNKFKKVCNDPDAVKKLLYENREKTATILNDAKFIEAWLSSAFQQDITLIIRDEAIKGDIPSLKQMVWFLGVTQKEISESSLSKKQRNILLTELMEDNLLYCNILIQKGLLQYNYQAMACGHDLCHALQEAGALENIEKIRSVINSTTAYANAVLKMGKDYPSFNGDAGFMHDAQTVIDSIKRFKIFYDIMENAKD